VPIFGGGFGDFAHVGRPNKYRPAGAVHSERGRYAALKGWLAVSIDAEFFIQFIEQSAYNLCFISFVEGANPLFVHLGILPLDELITYQRLKFMHSYYFHKFPISFAQIWQTNAERNPVRILRNGNDYFIPEHRIELVKRMPLYTSPAAWNVENIEKLNPYQPAYLKSLKKRLLDMLVI
jgi:hypothetical protein